MPYAAIVPVPFGALGLVMRGAVLAGIDFLPPYTTPQPARDEAIAHVVAQLQAYFRDPSTGFDLVLEPVGSPFQQRVWLALRAIPCGQVLTYAELARRVGSSPRAVGQAVGDNPLPIVIPCHRVVGRHDLGGFAHARSGPMLAIKRWLLSHEGALGR
ncbi:MAG: methylated-DNA--[protein]-cysteine S-methyltransferase [Thiobacillaceae bacterium]|nr:methylated-DNA--[protein]-cysteine S-methyltransferase [Thiobacillaceae bacterium]MDW8324467.1 methylated-DNA--[protein]-cysteine S-methyltransferase [Burkholderiales bacterium]